MSYRQPKTNNYFGFQPVSVGGGNVNFQVSPYLVSSSEGLINAGDVLTMTTLDTARVVTGAFIPTSSQAFLGVAANSMLANAGSTAATLVSNSSQMILVYDSPLQYFSGCDTTSGVGSNTSEPSPTRSSDSENGDSAASRLGPKSRCFQFAPGMSICPRRKPRASGEIPDSCAHSAAVTSRSALLNWRIPTQFGRV